MEATWRKYNSSLNEKPKVFSPAFLQFSLAVLSPIYTPEWGDVRRIRYPNQGHGTMIQLNMDPISQHVSHSINNRSTDGL